jgi:DNA-binding GntR family transcriptional regulator
LRNETTAAFWIRAVSSLTAEDLTDIRALIAKAWDKLNNPRIQIPHEEHRTFHLALLKHLDNPFVVGVEEGYWCAYEAVELNRYFDYQYLTTVWNYHERMINLIEQKKFEDSRLIFVEHTKLLIADGQRTT